MCSRTWATTACSTASGSARRSIPASAPSSAAPRWASTRSAKPLSFPKMSPFGRAFADGDRLEVAGAVVTLKVHRRARRVSLRLDPARGGILATAPTARRLHEAAAFARERANWIAERLAELPRAPLVAPGVVL